MHIFANFTSNSIFPFDFAHFHLFIALYSIGFAFFSWFFSIFRFKKIINNSSHGGSCSPQYPSGRHDQRDVSPSVGGYRSIFLLVTLKKLLIFADSRQQAKLGIILPLSNDSAGRLHLHHQLRERQGKNSNQKSQKHFKSLRRRKSATRSLLPTTPTDRPPRQWPTWLLRSPRTRMSATFSPYSTTCFRWDWQFLNSWKKAVFF